MIYKNDLGLHLYEFDSFEEYLNRATDPVFKNKQTTYGSDWPTPRWYQHLHYAKNGWVDVIQDINKWRDLVVRDITSQLPRPEIVYDKTGMFWDVGRVVEGDPDCWIQEDNTTDIDRQGKGNIIRIVINTASSAGVRTEFHTRRCGAILALSQLLETLGFYTQFEITTAIQVGADKIEFRTVAKRPHQMFNIAALAYWASQYMERHIDFAICETIPQCVRKSKKNGGTTHYGWPIGTHDGGDICFDRGYMGDTNWHSDEAAREYIIQQLAKQGVTLEGHKQ